MTETSYDHDFFAWTQAQAAALRVKDWDQLDLENLAEEIESLWSMTTGSRSHSSREFSSRRLRIWRSLPRYGPPSSVMIGGL